MFIAEEPRRHRAAGDHEEEAGEDRLRWPRLNLQDTPDAFVPSSLSNRCCFFNQSTVEHTETLNTFLIVYLFSPNMHVIRCLSYLIMLLFCLFVFYCLMRFCLNMNLCTVLCLCARMCLHNKHVTYVFLPAVWLMFILVVNIADVY